MRRKSMVPVPMRGPDEPTAYDLARASLGRAELDAWIRRWWRRRYVPEEVLSKMGLAGDRGTAAV